MTTLETVGLLVLAFTVLAVVPAAWILVRESVFRVMARRAATRLEAAIGALEADAAAPTPDLKAVLRRFNTATIERALEAMLRGTDERRVAWARRLFHEFGYVELYAQRIRAAPRWSDRTHAAQVLGLAASADAVPALVAAIRDPHEDLGSVKLAAAEALARLRGFEAIPLLVVELRIVDAQASPRIAEALVEFGSLALPAMLELLADSEHAAARVWAARILGRIGDPAATDGLVARLADRNDLLRGAVAEALGHIGDRRALQPIIQTTLRDPAPQVRAHAAAAASAIAGADAVDVLVAALADPDYGTRLRALEAFEHIEVRDTSGIESALNDPNLEVRRRAALALERVGFLSRVVDDLAAPSAEVSKRAYADLLRLGTAGLIDSIAGHVHHTLFEVRASVARACGDLANARVGPVLVAALDDPEWPVRASLCDAIGRLRVEGALASLVPMLTDANDVVREAAMQAVAEYADDLLAPYWDTVVKAYKTGSVPMRWHVVGMAERVSSPDAFALLVEGSEDPSERVRARAVAALSGRPEGVGALIARLADPALDVRVAAVVALGSGASEEAFEGLVGALAGAKPEVRERIAQALAKTAQGTLLDRLLALAGSESTDMRLGIAWTLGKTGDAAGVAPLARLLGDREPAVRRSAAGALGKIPGPATVAALHTAADDRDARTRAAVVNALAKTACRGDGTHEIVEGRLDDPDAFVRNRAIVALARLGDERTESIILAAEKEGRVAPAAAALAWTLIPGERALDRALSILADPEFYAPMAAFVAAEEPPIRGAFYERLHLEPPRTTELTLEASALVVHYERVLRSSQTAEGRLVAIDALGRIPHDRSIDLLADAVGGDPVEAVRVRAAHALANASGNAMALRALVRVVADPNAAVALVAIRALGAARAREGSAALFRRLGLGVEEVETAVEEALAAIYAASPVAFVDCMMGDDRPEAIAAAAHVLERMGSLETRPILMSLVESSEAVVRAAGVRALAVFSDQESMQAVRAGLDDPSERVRAEAIDAILRTRSEGALVYLGARIRSDPATALRVRFSAAIEPFVGAAANGVLASLTDDTQPEVRGAAFATLLARANVGGLTVFAQHWSKAALDTRRELRQDRRVGRIAERLAGLLAADPHPTTRASAVSAIAALAVPGWPAQLGVALRDPDVAVRLSAVRALASVDDRDVRARVSELLADPDEQVRAAARKAQIRVVG